MVATLRKRYATIAMALVLLTGIFGWTPMVGLAASMQQTGAMHVHTTHQIVGFRPHSECPPPPYNCIGG